MRALSKTGRSSGGVFPGHWGRAELQALDVSLREARKEVTEEQVDESPSGVGVVPPQRGEWLHTPIPQRGWSGSYPAEEYLDKIVITNSYYIAAQARSEV